jgi:energy-converting hydrogenase Eha subunit B
MEFMKKLENICFALSITCIIALAAVKMMDPEEMFIASNVLVHI